MVSGFVSDKNKTKAVQYKLSGHNSSALSSETVPAGQTECRENYGQMPHAMLKKHRASGKYRAKPLTSQQTQTTMNTEANRKTEWVVGIGEALWGHTARRAEDRRSRELRLPHVAVRAAQLRGQRRRRRRGGTRTPQPAPRKRGGTYAGNGAVPDRDGRSHARRGGHPQLRDPAGRSLGQHTVHPADRGASPGTPVQPASGRWHSAAPYRTARSGVSWKRCPTARDNTRSSTSTCGSTLHAAGGRRVAAEVQHLEDKRRRTGRGRQHVRLGGMQPGEQCRTLLDRYGLRIVILTCGAAGVRYSPPDTRSYILHAARRSSRHGRCRGLVHGIVPGRPALGARHRGSYTGWPWMSRPTSARSTAPCPGCRNGLPLGCAMTAPPYDRDDRDARNGHPPRIALPYPA